jgi:prepilin-type processing-associated H-X9-DG protein
MRSRASPRSGLTIAEVIVVVVIVALLTALLLPAIQSARETARNASCRNNLRQLGLALAQYEATHGIYPPSLTGINIFSQFSVLLPYLEQKPTYQLLVEIQNEQSPRARELSALPPVSVFLCPSEAEPPLNGLYTSYAGNSGTGLQTHGYDGVFQPLFSSAPSLMLGNGPVRAASITDGLSNTVAFAEWLYQANPTTRKLRLRSIWATPQPFHQPDELEEFRAVCESLPPQPDLYGWRANTAGKGTRWFDGNLSESCYNHILTPNQPSCTNGIGNITYSAFTAGSCHPAGVNVCFVDGHGTTVSDKIALQVWREMGSRAKLTRRFPVP